MSAGNTGAAGTADDDLATTLADLATDVGRRPLLVALDFDGTLAPLVDDPDDSQMLPTAADALARLATTPGSCSR